MQVNAILNRIASIILHDFTKLKVLIDGSQILFTQAKNHPKIVIIDNFYVETNFSMLPFFFVAKKANLPFVRREHSQGRKLFVPCINKSDRYHTTQYFFIVLGKSFLFF